MGISLQEAAVLFFMLMLLVYFTQKIRARVGDKLMMG